MKKKVQKRKKLTHKINRNAPTIVFFMFLIVILIAIPLVLAVYGDYIKSFDTAASGADQAYGLAANNSHVFVLETQAGDHSVYYFHNNGTYSDKKWTVNASVAVPRGIDFNGTYFFITDATNKYIYVFNQDGTDVKRIALTDLGTYMGITANDSRIWTSNIDDNTIYQYDFTGNKISSFTAGTNNPTGLEINDSNLFIIDQDASTIMKFDFSGNSISNVSLTAANAYAYGLASNGTVFYVQDQTDQEVYIYDANIYVPLAGSGITVSLNTPANRTSIEIGNNAFIATHTAENFNLQNTTYKIYYINGTLLNSTTYAINSSNITKQNFNIGFGNYNWNTYTCGENLTQTICIGAVNNFSFDAGASVLAISFPANVSETERAQFHLNISVDTGVNLYAARLNYNGTRYLGTKSQSGTNYIIQKTIDVPLLKNAVRQNISFFWEFEYRNGFEGAQNTSTYSHIVNPLIFQRCNETYSQQHWNISISNESSRTPILNTLDGTFNFWLGSGTVKKNYTLDNTGQTDSNYSFCANRENLNVSSIINIKANNFKQRTFYFNKQNINSSITQTELYLLDVDLGSEIIVEVTDPGLVAQVGKYVNVYRYYPEVNKYYIIEKAKTDEFGQFVAFLIEPNTIKYQFEFLDEDNNLLKRTSDMTIACRSTYCVIPFVIEGDEDDFIRFSNVTDFEYTLAWSNSTQTFTYTWNDVTGDIITSRLLVQKTAFNGTTIICNSTSTSLSSSMTCNVGDIKGNYRAQVFRQVSGKAERRIAVLNIEYGDAASTFGLEGLFWSFILLFTLIGVGAYNPSVGVGLYLVGFIALGALGIFSMPTPILIATIVLGGIFIWAIRT